MEEKALRTEGLDFPLQTFLFTQPRLVHLLSHTHPSFHVTPEITPPIP